MNTLRRRKSLLTFGRIITDAFRDLLKNDPLRMAGATAFFTMFALPPIMIILTQLLGMAFNQRKISRKLFQGLGTIIEKESVQQIVHTLLAFRGLADNWFVTIAGFIFLLFIATTLFKIIKGSINQIWRIRVVRKRSLWISLRPRIQSVLVIVMAGILFVPGLLATSLQAFLSRNMYQFSPSLTFYFNSALNYVVSVLIIMLWFAVVFRYLADGRPKWKVALTGALVTSLLFNTGKLVLHQVLVRSSIHDVYGPSGSMVLLLLFVFYSSLILYYGTAFTRAWGAYHDAPIKPLPHAMLYKVAGAEDADEEE